MYEMHKENGILTDFWSCKLARVRGKQKKHVKLNGWAALENHLKKYQIH